MLNTKEVANLLSKLTGEKWGTEKINYYLDKGVADFPAPDDVVVPNGKRQFRKWHKSTIEQYAQNRIKRLKRIDKEKERLRKIREAKADTDLLNSTDAAKLLTKMTGKNWYMKKVSAYRHSGTADFPKADRWVGGIPYWYRSTITKYAKQQRDAP